MDQILTELDSRLFEMLSKSSNRVYFYYADVKKNVARWSPSAVEYFGLPGEILSPSTLWDEKVHPDDYAEYQQTFIDMVTHVTPKQNCEYRVTNAQNEYVWVNCHGYMNYDETGYPVFFAGFVTNMGTVNKIDAVTGLWTGYGFRHDVAKMLEMDQSGAAMQIDIDNFKQINASYGYQFGDKVLRVIGQKIHQACGPQVKVYRMDGAQFAVCMNGDKQQLLDCKDRMLREIEELSVDGVRLHIDYYIGATVFPNDAAFIDQIQSNLYYSLAHAKQERATDLVFFSRHLYEERNCRLRLNSYLKRSIGEGFRGFRLVLQPVIDAKTGELHSAEVLLRWNNEHFPKIGPAEFMPLLEETQRIIPVGKWLIDRAFAMISEWNQNTGEKRLPHININFSYIQLVDETLKDYVIGKLDEYHLPHDMLVAELTESCKIEYSDDLAQILHSYREEGVMIALDDFGTGYASLMVLKDIPADIVKLDYTMIRTIEDRPKDRNLVEFIITYCNQMEIEVCTEGVETEQTLGIVKEAGATYIQGYYYDKPLETDEFYEKYIRRPSGRLGTFQ